MMKAFQKGLAIALTLGVTSPVVAQDSQPPVFSQYGGVGLLRTRSARMAPDGTLTAGVAWHSELQRYSLSFQAAPWLETTFSYAGFDNAPTNSTFDRQFDIKIRLWEESFYTPEIAVGLQDFLGTGLFASEYFVASKRIGPLDLSFGVGWGRLASRGVAENPARIVSSRFDTRADVDGQGGEVNFGQFFQGEDIGIFGGVVYDTPVDGLRVIAEYDSDNNDVVFGLDDNSPFNFGLVYNVTPGIQLGASYISGDQVALTAAFSNEAGRWIQDAPPGGDAPAFYVREPQSDAAGGKDGLVAPVQPLIFTPSSRADLPEVLRNEMRREGLGLIRLQIGIDTLRVVIDNDRYRSYAKAVGRATRILSRFAPAEFETFQVAIDQSGLESAEFVLDRAQLESSASEIGYSIAPPSLAFSYITPGSRPIAAEELSFAEYPDFNWSIGPDLRLNTFDPDDPLRAQLDLELNASLEVTRGLVFSTSIATDLIGNFDNNARESDSVLPRVRTEFQQFNDETDIGLFRLTGEYFFSPAPNLYAKIAAGYLEQQFAGVGGELLWRPQNSRLSFGVEAFYAQQREFDTRFGFQDFGVATGHASVYYDTAYNNWNVAVHAGRYLARDLGATFELSRRFPNGWEIGAFATFTDVPFDEFGEGSFDKGITLRIPFDWGLPNDTTSSGRLTLRPVQRDGGQRLRVPNRLFGLTQPTNRGEIASQWATFAH